MKKSSNIYSAWLIITLFFVYQYILRVAPGVMINEIRNTYKMSAQEFSLLGAYYQYAYAILQIPMGLLLDKIGVRKIILVSLAICLLGSLILSNSSCIFYAQFSRILVGIGSASAFMGAMKIVTDGLPVGRRGFLMGMTLSLGTLGTLITGKPLVWLIQMSGWRQSLDFIAIFGVILWFFCFIFLPIEKKDFYIARENYVGNFGEKILSILKNRTIWIYGFVSMGIYSPLASLTDLWGTSFLMTKFKFMHSDAAQFSMLIYLGMCIGGLIIPWMAEKNNYVNRGIRIGNFFVVLFLAILIYAPFLSVRNLFFCLILLGFSAGVETLCFAGAVQNVDKNHSGLTIGTVNTLNMLAGAVLQQGIGRCLDWRWSGLYNDLGVKLYQLKEYTLAFSILIIVALVSSIMSFLLKDKKKPKKDICKMSEKNFSS